MVKTYFIFSEIHQKQLDLALQSDIMKKSKIDEALVS